MTISSYRIVTFNTQFDRQAFCSNSEPLNQYLKTQVSQDIKRRISTCYLAVTQQDSIAGYYTLAANSILLTDLPDTIRKKMPRYPTVPAVLMGRLAIDKSHLRKGLGSALLVDALKRANNAEMAVYALIVDAKDDNAKDFYSHFGFIPFKEQSHKLFYPLANLTHL